MMQIKMRGKYKLLVFYKKQVSFNLSLNNPFSAIILKTKKPFILIFQKEENPSIFGI